MEPELSRKVALATGNKKDIGAWIPAETCLRIPASLSCGFPGLGEPSAGWLCFWKIANITVQVISGRSGRSNRDSEAIAQAVAQSGRRDLLADCADLPDPRDSFNWTTKTGSTASQTRPSFDSGVPLTFLPFAALP
jgi:hypothetical protein